MDKYAHYQNRYYYYKNQGENIIVAQHKAITEMIALGYISSADEIKKDAKERNKKHGIIVNN